MKVSEAMSRDVRIASPDETIRDAAMAMAAIDAGVLPVAENNMLVGMVTDRDISVRAVAAGKGPDTPVRDVLSKEVLFCFDDQDLEHVAKSMGHARVRRVPVLARDHRLVGLLSLGDVALRSPEAAGSAVRELSKRGGPHSQSARRPAHQIVSEVNMAAPRLPVPSKPSRPEVRTSAGARGAKRGTDARGDSEKQKENQRRLDVGTDHRTSAMKRGRRGTFP
ncbi:MAG TPA: CBS domain-containing protein [Burkholderiales bacterium]|nr:CBS domain-containing protein [Burkholderiales bacterium]